MFGINTHGEERTKKITVEGGKQVFTRREKFCVKHGWIDVLGIGGDLAWRRLHAHCNTTTHTGAFVMPPRAMGKAA